MKITTEQTIEKFRKTHGDRYDYSHVHYSSAKTKVTVVCRDHGAFEVTPNNHLSGTGCPRCVKMTFDDFVVAARKVHGDRYEYKKYQPGYHEIICREHGSFYANTHNHVKQGTNCPSCANQTRKSKARSTKDIFVEKSRLAHGDRYDYTRSEYLGAHTKTTITCRTHGDFMVSPANHWSNGVGCPSCQATSCSKGEAQVAKWLDDRSVEYMCQKSFPGLYYKRKNARLKFDFYIPAHRLLIEYDGEYHYKPISYSKEITPEEQFSITQERDALKTKYAQDNGYRLVRIRFDQDIDLAMQALCL